MKKENFISLIVVVMIFTASIHMANAMVSLDLDDTSVSVKNDSVNVLVETAPLTEESENEGVVEAQTIDIDLDDVNLQMQNENKKQLREMKHEGIGEVIEMKNDISDQLENKFRMRLRNVFQLKKNQKSNWEDALKQYKKEKAQLKEQLAEAQKNGENFKSIYEQYKKNSLSKIQNKIEEKNDISDLVANKNILDLDKLGDIVKALSDEEKRQKAEDLLAVISAKEASLNDSIALIAERREAVRNLTENNTWKEIKTVLKSYRQALRDFRDSLKDIIKDLKELKTLQK